MASVHDVANYILKARGEISTWKLQKLLYYSQAWHLVWLEKPLFQADFQAWANGPVAPAIYKIHRGRFSVSEWPKGDASKLDEGSKRAIDAVLDSYGNLSGFQLSELTHGEDPWNDARKGLPPTASSQVVISKQALQGYYTALAHDDDAVAVDKLDW